MKRSQVYKNLLLALGLMLGLSGISANAQSDSAKMQAPEAAMGQLSTQEVRSVRAAVARPVNATFWAVTQDFEGNFDNVDELMAKFEREAKAQGIPNANPVGVLVLWEDPEQKSSFKMSVGVTLTSRVAVKEPLKVNRWTFSEAVRYTHVGAYNRLGAVGRNVQTEIKARPASRMKAGMATAQMKTANEPFAVLRLVSDPKKVKPAQLRTELIMPVMQ